MKKILLILMLVVVSSVAKPCMTDIYFGNGVWNPDRDEVRKIQLRALKVLMLSRTSTPLNKADQNKLFQWKLAYNPSGGTSDDLIETFYQLKESGQITEGYFTFILNITTGDLTIKEAVEKYRQIVSTYKKDFDIIYRQYENSSFSKKHNILLVAHSQGNLFGNKMYTLMTDAQKEKFRMVSVGTPANHVMEPNQTAPYVTLYGDFVIRSIPDSLSANTNGGGHTFVGAYLGKIDARIKISAHIKTAYDDLIQTMTCNKYWAINMALHTEGYMEVFGYPVLGGRNVYVRESIGIAYFESYTKTIEKDVSGNIIKVCNVAPNIVKRWGDIDLCYSSDDTCSWKAGEIYNKSTLERRKNLSYIMTSKDYSTCIHITHSGELYELTKDLFDN